MMPSIVGCFKEVYNTITLNFELIKASTRREIEARYRGSMLGIFWSFLSPLIMLIIFTFVFSVIFKARWGAGGASKVEFGLILYIGLIIFNLFSEIIQRAPVLILANTNYVKKIVYPLEILPLVSILSALFHAILSLMAWFAIYVLFIGVPHITTLYLPFLLLPFCILLYGLSLFFSALGVYLRDVSQLIGPMMTALMFLSPVFYPISSFPENYQFVLYINPLTVVVEQMRDVLFWGENPDAKILGIFWLLSLFIALFSFALFRKLRDGFADVL